MIALLGLRLARSTVETLLDRAPKVRRRSCGSNQSRARRGRRRPTRVHGRPHPFHRRHRQGPRTYPIDRVEEIKRRAQDAVSKALSDADLTFTAVPVARDNESVRERIMVIARNSGLAIHHVTVHDLGEKLIVGIDLEVDGDMELAAATTSRTGWNEASARISARMSRSIPTSSRWSRNSRTAPTPRPAASRPSRPR